MKRKIVLTLALLALPLSLSRQFSKRRDSEYFSLTATVTEVLEDYIEVDVYGSDYAFGIYHVIVGDAVKIKDEKGREISRAALKPHDKVQISYSGQVMMSYPPKSAARMIKVIT